MSEIITQLEGYLDKLKGAGVRATMDPRSVNPPTVLLAPPDFDLDVGCGGTAEFHAFVLAPPPANLDAWRALDDIAAKVADVIPIERIRATTYGVDDTSAIPALDLSWTQALSWP